MARSTTKTLIHTALSIALLGATTGSASSAQVDTDGMQLDLPAWSLIFKKKGEVKQSRLGSGEAFYFADAISNGKAVDPTVMFRRIKELRNGKKRVVVTKKRIVRTTVNPANDLGHIYLVTGVTAAETRAVYMAADVLTRNAPHNVTYEFELSQKGFQIMPLTGDDKLQGMYSDGDLRALVKFRQGNPHFLSVKRFNNKTAGKSGWATMMMKHFDSSNCVSDDDNVLACVSSTPNGGSVRSAKHGRNSKGKRVKVPQTDMRIEIGFEVDELSGVSTSFESMLVRSRYDLALMPLVNGVKGNGTGNPVSGSVLSQSDDDKDKDKEDDDNKDKDDDGDDDE